MADEIKPSGFTHNRRQAAKYLGVSYGTLGNWGSSRINIPFAVVGGEAWYRQSDLDHYLFRREVKVLPVRQRA